MIDKRFNYRFGGGYQGGATNQGGAGKGSGVEGGGARGQAMGMGGKQKGGTGKTTGGSGGPDKSAVGQFSQYGRNVMAKNLNPNLRFDPKTGGMKTSFMSGIGSKLLGGILGLINPVLGLGYRAITNAPGVFDKFKSSSTLEQFRDKLRGYGRTMPVYSNNPMFGGIDSLRTDLNIDSKFEDYLDFQKSTPDNVTFEEYLENIQNAPTGILNSSVLPSNNLLAFNPGSLKDKLIKNVYSGYTELGVGEDKLKDLMKEDIKQNQEKGTPLSLPKQAYSLIG